MMKHVSVGALILTASIFAGLSNYGHSQNEQPATPPAPAADMLPDLNTMPQDPTMPAPPAGQPGLPPSVPGVPPAGVGMPGVNQPGLPDLPPGLPGTAQPAMPGLQPGAMPTAPVNPFGATPPGGPASSVPMPPQIGSLAADSTAVDPASTTPLSQAAAPSQLYTFLFIDDPDYGVIRQRFNTDVARELKEQEINRLADERRQGQSPFGGVDIPGVTPMGMGGMDPMMMDSTMGMGMGMGMEFGGMGATGGLNTEEAIRAAAEWDFYYDQLEMYDRFVREKLVPESEDLPELQYDVTNVLQERQDLFESFQEAAIEQSNEEFNENKLFYERLQLREDRRRAYLNWMMLREREVADWAEVWARKIYGQRWADGDEVRVDDWYYGTDFNSSEPVIVEIDNREYVISRQPVANLAEGQLNVLSTNLTPYDIVDSNGYLKNPVMETMRGTVVIPPPPPVYDVPEPTTGTIEIIEYSPF